MLKAVIFDMDGVLIDSEPLHAKAAVIALQKINVNLSVEYCYQFIGKPTAQMLESIIADYDLTYTTSDLLDLYNKAKQDLLSKEGYSPIPYTKELIEDLYQHGIKLAIASSSTVKEITDVVHSLDIDQYFQKLVSGTTVTNPKPAPDVFLKAVKELGVNINECMIIEDSHQGLMAGKAAGIPVIGFANPNSGNQDLSGACIIIEGFEEVDFHFIHQLYTRTQGEPLIIANTPRLMIRELTDSDLKELRKIYAQPEIQKFIEMDKNLDIEMEKQKSYIKNVYPFYGYGLWGIFHKEANQLIGQCGIQNITILGKEEIELGYLLSKEFWGNGYAIESIHWVLDYAYRVLQFNRVVALIDIVNHKSIQVAEHIGMIKEKVITQNNKKYLLYSLDLPCLYT